MNSARKHILLNPHDYHMEYVPIQWSWGTVIVLNVIIFITVLLVLILPTRFITLLNPIQHLSLIDVI
ncbi:MAG: hypothetical protein U5K54_06905 [Cytophagales bacterium]|nr:hypothetical protein [Cytophagales bacterium]